MADTRIVIQILFQPVIGRPVRRWWWRRGADRDASFLRQDTQQRKRARSPTSRERQAADAIEAKSRTNRFYTTIRFAIIGAEEYTRSRIKELSGGFNVFENSDTGQYFDISTVETVRTHRLNSFCQAIADREFAGWSKTFQTSVPELAALVAIPDRAQKNIQNALP